MEGPQAHNIRQPLVSIIVPAYNAGAYLADCLRSIITQSQTDLEIIVVDDGSTDSGPEIAEGFKLQDQRVRLLRMENAGPSAARNLGLAHARGRYVQFVDADDALDESCCRMMGDAAVGSAADLVVCQAQILDAGSTAIGLTPLPGGGSFTVQDLLRQITPTTKATLLHYVWNKWYRLDLIRSIGLQFDTSLRLGEDFVFNCGYWPACTHVELVNTPLYHYYRRGESSLTNQFLVDELERRRRMDFSLFELYSSVGLLKECEGRLSVIVGAIALDSIGRVALSGANVSHDDRVQYVDQFLKSEYRERILDYVRSEHATAVHRLQGILVRLSSSRGLLHLNALRFRIRRVHSRVHAAWQESRSK